MQSLLRLLVRETWRVLADCMNAIIAWRWGLHPADCRMDIWRRMPDNASRPTIFVSKRNSPSWCFLLMQQCNRITVRKFVGRQRYECGQVRTDAEGQNVILAKIFAGSQIVSM